MSIMFSSNSAVLRSAKLIRCTALWNRWFAISSDPILINESIIAPSMRVIYLNKETNKNEWKIMDRAEALQFAKKMQLDLVLGMALHFFLLVY